MRHAARIVVVLTAGVVWLVLGTYGLWTLGIGTVRSDVEEFSAALSAAQVDTVRQDLTSPTFSVCGFPGGEPAQFELAHDAVVTVARCLHRRGYLGSRGLIEVERSRFEIVGGCGSLPEVPGTVEIVTPGSCSWS